MKTSPPVFNDHNVYILGAGFSVRAGLPVVSDFMDRMRDSPNWLGRNGFERAADAVRRVLGFRLESAGASYRIQIDPENIEQLFSLAAARGDHESDEFDDDDVPRAIAGTLEYAKATSARVAAIMTLETAKLHLAPATWKEGKTLATFQRKMPLYEALLGIMTNLWSNPQPNCQNTLISFNYDLVVEAHLGNLKIPFSYGFREGTVHRVCAGYAADAEMRLLKLHGSVNWSVCDDAETKDGTTPAIDLSRIHLHDDFRALSRRNADPVLIPPTWRKGALGPLSEVWMNAVGAIQNATRIIVIGYSMPTIYQHFKYLLAAGLQRNVSLRKIIFVNPGLDKNHREAAELRARITSVLRPELVDRGMIDFSGSGVENFLGTPDSRRAINRELPPILQNPVVGIWGEVDEV